jgi:drug/metabolite transporter superfamily protein YnfA
MRNRGFQWFVVIAGGILLILNTFLVVKLKDDGSARILPLYAAIYVIYLIMFIRMEHKRRKEGGADKQVKSPLMK